MYIAAMPRRLFSYFRSSEGKENPYDPPWGTRSALTNLITASSTHAKSGSVKRTPSKRDAVCLKNAEANDDSDSAERL